MTWLAAAGSALVAKEKADTAFDTISSYNDRRNSAQAGGAYQTKPIAGMDRDIASRMNKVDVARFFGIPNSAARLGLDRAIAERDNRYAVEQAVPAAIQGALIDSKASGFGKGSGALLGADQYLSGATSPEDLVNRQNQIKQVMQMEAFNPQLAEQAQMAEQQAMLEQEQGNMFRSNQIAAQEQALNPLAAPQTPTEQLAAATDADALARIQANRPVPDYGTQTTMLNPYSKREQVIPHVGTPEFNKQQSGIDAGVRLIGQFQNMRSLIEDMGPTGTDWWGADAKKFDTNRGLMATEMAIMQELGVLSESDIELVLAGAEDVTSFGSNLEATILGPFVSAGSLVGADWIKGTSLAGYDEIQRFVETKIIDYYKRNPYVDIDRAKLSQRMRLQLEPPER